MNELLDGTLVQARDAVASGQCSARDLTAAAIERIDALQPTLNFAISLRYEQALDAADAVDKACAKGALSPPLAGVPLMHKDMYHRAGEISTYGSSIFRKYCPTRSATVIERLDAAGAIDLGRLNMAEFAVGLTGHNRHYGDCRNPWNPAHITGGSSSGSGAATAARCVFAALGSDTGGSIRLPATVNGVAGLKPTQTRISRAGVMPLSSSLDCVGPLARSVADCALLFELIAGADASDASCSRLAVPDAQSAARQGASDGLPGLRIGKASSYYEDELDPEIAALMALSRQHFADLGAEIVGVDVPDHPAVASLQNVLMGGEAASVHRDNLSRRFDDISPQVRARLLPGLAYSGGDYHDAARLRPLIARRFIDAVFAEADLLLIPSIPIPAPTLDQTRVDDGPELPALIARVGRCTRPINYLGLPALSVPMGLTRNGLPFAIQLVARPFGEALLCRAGAAFEARCGFLQQQRPALLEAV